MNILVVDDDDVVLRAHERILEAGGFAVTAVDNGFTAFETLDEIEFRAIVCDHKMPYLDGKTLFEQLEEKYPNISARVVFVTGCAGDPRVESFLDKTGQPVLFKPVDAEELIRVVNEMASRPI